jgi:arylsulfatase A-like enzyme
MRVCQPCFAVAAGIALATSSAEARNVLVIVADDVGADKIDGFADYGAKTPSYLPATPGIADLRAAGVSFSQAWAMPECSPTRASFHTGEYPSTTGIGVALGQGEAGLDDASWVTLAEVARAGGHATGLFGKWHLGATGSAGSTLWSIGEGGATETRNERPAPVLAGFDTFVGGIEAGVPDFEGWTRVTYPSLAGRGWTDLAWETNHADDVVVDRATNWINRQRTDWFAMVNFFSAQYFVIRGAGKSLVFVGKWVSG